MSSLEIQCPHCGKSIELTEALAGPVLESERQRATAEAERRLASERKSIADAAAAKAHAEDAARIEELQRVATTKDAELDRAREAEVAARRAKQEAEEAKRNVNLEVSRRVAEQTITAAKQAREDTAREYAIRLAEAEAAVAERDAKLGKAQTAEIEARRAKREAEDAKRETELLVERKLEEERAKVRDQALKERDDEYRLKLQEKERQLSDLKDKLDEAQRKADSGSSQLHGEVLEVDLHDALKAAFPTDEFERIKKGQRGGDLIQTVRSVSGVVCGRIKWESKNTQHWSDTWLAKLREDQRAHKCDLAALMSEALPNGLSHFDVIEDVWVSSIAMVVPMATALRAGLIETATARRTAVASESKKDLVFAYLLGPEFRGRVRAIAEPLIEMRSSLESEKRSAARQFAAREKQLERIGLNLSGMYGDLQGLAGPSLPTVEGLSLPEPAHGREGNPPALGESDHDAPIQEVH